MKKVGCFFFQKEATESLITTKCIYIKLPEAIVAVTCWAVVCAALLGQAQAAGVNCAQAAGTNWFLRVA